MNEIRWFDNSCPKHFGNKAPCELCFKELQSSLVETEEALREKSAELEKWQANAQGLLGLLSEKNEAISIAVEALDAIEGETIDLKIQSVARQALQKIKELMK